MPAASSRSVTFGLTGDVPVTPTTYPALANTSSPGAVVPMALSLGDNAVAVPTGATALTILKPSGNTVLLKLKAVNGDAGVALHHTDPDSISLDPSQAALVLNAASPVTVRLVWT